MEEKRAQGKGTVNKTDDTDGFKLDVAYEHDWRFWLYLPGMSLEKVELAAIKAAHARHLGHRRSMQEELKISKSSLIRKLDELGLRGEQSKPSVGVAEE
jgi:DNA-binding NtrC family response regulator